MEIEEKIIGLRALPRKQINITFAGVMLAMFLGSLDQTIVGTAMPRIISDLGGFAHYTWLTTAYIITSAVAIPITGKLTDMYGRKLFYIAGLSIFTVASLLCGLSNTMAQIIIFRGIQGIGGGIMISNAFTVIGDLFPPVQRGKYQGAISGVFALSSIAGPALGGFLTDTVSWHWVFFVNIPLGIMVIVLFIFFFPHVRPDNLKHRIDYVGVVTLVLTVVPAMLALSWAGSEYPWSSPQIIGIFVFAAIMLALFIWTEKRSAEPIIPLWLFKNRIVAVSELVIFFSAFGMFGGIIFIPLFFQGVKGVSAADSGRLVTPMMLGLVAGSFISGQLLSRAGGRYRIQGAIGIGIMALGIALLSRMTMETSNSVVIIYIVLTGFGLGITMPLYTIAIQNAVPYNVLGVATSSAAFLRSIGGSIGLAVFGSVMTNRFMSEFIEKIPPAIKSLVPMERLTTLAHNPQALMSPEAQSQLQATIGNLGPQGATVYQQVLGSLRLALNSAISRVFLLAFIVTLLALVINFFIKEIPLRKEHILIENNDGAHHKNKLSTVK